MLEASTLRLMGNFHRKFAGGETGKATSSCGLLGSALTRSFPQDAISPKPHETTPQTALLNFEPHCSRLLGWTQAPAPAKAQSQ